MNAHMNGERLSAKEANALLNRGFRFGDGCFETMLVKAGVCPLLSLHQKRLERSLKALHLQWPADLALQQQVENITEGSIGWQRLRLWVWRSGSGLYTPAGTTADWIISVEASAPPSPSIRQQAGISRQVQLAASSYSFIKSISAQAYVMAGLEKQERQLDELILLNGKGELTEATSSNLFIKKRNRWFTPALSTGCVAGVMRTWLMQQLLNKGEPAYEVHALPEELDKVDKVVCTNVSGLFPIGQLGDKQYNTDVDELWQFLPQEYQQA